jgi:hypothetical protein
MTHPFSPYLSFLSYFFTASLVWGILLYLLRGTFHRSFSRLPLAKQLRLQAAWRRMLAVTRLSLILLPFASIAIIIPLTTIGELPVPLTGSVFLLMYLNIVVIHFDRIWHVKALDLIAKHQGNDPAA